jgi:hypothetical protein
MMNSGRCYINAQSYRLTLHCAATGRGIHFAGISVCGITKSTSVSAEFASLHQRLLTDPLRPVDISHAHEKAAAELAAAVLELIGSLGATAPRARYAPRRSTSCKGPDCAVSMDLLPPAVLLADQMGHSRSNFGVRQPRASARSLFARDALDH